MYVLAHRAQEKFNSPEAPDIKLENEGLIRVNVNRNGIRDGTLLCEELKVLEEVFC